MRGRSRGLVAASIAAACIVFPVLRHAEGFPLAEEALKVKGAQAPRWFTHVYSRNDGGDLYAKSVEEVVPSGSALFGSWEGINVLRYHQLVKDGLAGVQLYYSYTPWLIKELIDSTNPDRVYFTFAPEDPEFEVVDVIDVGTTGDKLYLIDCKSNRADSTGGSQSEKDTSR